MSKGLREKRTHVALKLLAYLYFDRKPSVEKRISRPFRYKPDLAIEEKDGVLLWVECGKVAVKKLKKLAAALPRAEIFVFRKSLSSARTLRSGLGEKTLKSGRLKFISFEKSFVDKTAEIMEKVTSISFRKSSGKISLNINSKHLNSNIFIL